MIDFNSAISTIRDNNGFEANEHDSSYYRVYTVDNQRPLQVRISNHGTHLWTWDEKAEYMPHRGHNISIVFMSSSKGYCESDTSVNMDIFEKDANGNKIKVGTIPNFEVIQYVYDCDILTPNNVARINQFIQQIPTFKKYIDPMKTNPQKRAKVYKLTPNNAPEIITENINCNRIMNKNKIRLTESQLHKVIKESMKRVLKEGKHDATQLPSILEDMASYAQECLGNGEDLQGYFGEIINTGLYHDACGKSIDFKDGVNYFTTDY